MGNCRKFSIKVDRNWHGNICGMITSPPLNDPQLKSTSIVIFNTQASHDAYHECGKKKFHLESYGNHFTQLKTVFNSAHKVFYFLNSCDLD